MKTYKFLGKLIVLTLAIYWFISKGLQQSVHEAFHVGSAHPAVYPWQDVGSFWMVWLVVIYLAWVGLRSVYQRKVRKPKTALQKKYGKLRR